MKYRQRKYFIGALIAFCCLYVGVRWFYSDNATEKLFRLNNDQKPLMHDDKQQQSEHHEMQIEIGSPRIGYPPKVVRDPTLKPTEIVDNNAVSKVSDFYVDDFYENLQFKLGDKGLYDVKDPGFDSLENVTTPINNEHLTIIVVPHSHNDPGWLWTLQTYYEVRTRNILTSTVTFLKAHPDFRMIWSETVFLKMWWDETTPQMRQDFQELVNQGKVEILSGGWVSVDEATTHYTAVIDQLIEGHQWLGDNLGVHVNTSWSIDPFGYSMSLPYLWKKSGMKDMAILRIHGAIKKRMGNRKLLTFQWRQQWDSRGEHDIQCHVEPYTLYNIEHSCGPDMAVCAMLDAARQTILPGNNEFRLPDQTVVRNFDHFMEKLVNNYLSKASNYEQNVILMPHGDDFRYIYEYEWESQRNQMLKVMNYVNENPKWNITMRFGTVGEYFDLLEKEQSKHDVYDSTITGDFFTYTDRDNEYWSGYYTTRPFDKRNIRWLLEMIKTAEMLTSYALVKARQSGKQVNEKSILELLQEARRAHGLVQHHDAITGTSTASTQIDFRKRINDAIRQIQMVTSSILPLVLMDEIISGPHAASYQPMEVQENQNKHQSDVIVNVGTSEQEVVFINIHTQPRNEIVSIVTNTANIEIYDFDGNLMHCQIVPEWENIKTVSSNKFRVYFEIRLPAVSLGKFRIKMVKQTSFVHFSKMFVYNGGVNKDGGSNMFGTTQMGNLQTDEFKLTTNQIQAFFSSKYGFLRKICQGEGFKKCSDVELDFRTYHTENSNAYCFGTTVHRPFALIEHGTPLVKVISGPIVNQVIVYHPVLNHVVTMYNTSEYQGKSIYISNMVNFQGNDKKNKELIMTIKTDFLNPQKNFEYYTDSNGFQMVKRQYRDILPFGANFYPMTSMALVDTASERLTLHSAQAHGIGNVGRAELLVMMDRMPINNGKGLEEPVTDNLPTLSKFVLSIEDKKKSSENTENKYGFKLPSLFSHQVNEYLQLPVQMFARVSGAMSDTSPKKVEILNSALLPDVSLVNVKTLINKQFEISGTGLTFHKKDFSSKFEGYLRQDESIIDLGKLFGNLNMRTVIHTCLTHVRHKLDISTNKVLRIKTGELESVLVEW